MPEVYITAAARTAIGTFGGTLSGVGAVELGRVVVTAALERAGLAGDRIDEVVMGNVLSAGLGQSVARQVAIGCGIPDDRTALAVNMVCGSGLRSVALAAQSIRCGDADVIVAGGTENMSAAPYLLDKARTGYRMGNGELIDSMIRDGLWEIFNDYHMGVTAENLADRYSLTREEQDEFAARSQQLTERAIDDGRFRDEIAPVEVPRRKGAPVRRKGEPVVFDTDEHPRRGVTAESLAKLRPAFRPDGTVTAGNASGINDGAAAVVVAGEEAVARENLQPMARIASYAWAGVDPAYMGIGPVEATRKALAKAGWSLDEVDLVEANEAFAAQSLAVGRELGWDLDRVNVNGGAIALGHPIGASGARILVTLLHEMARRDVRKGLATLCIGGGMGIAMCVENHR